RVLGLDSTPEGVGFQYSIFFLEKIWRSRAKIVLRLLPFLIDSMRFSRRAIRGFFRRSLDAKLVDSTMTIHDGASIPFTGKLLPGNPVVDPRNDRLTALTSNVRSWVPN